MKAVWATTTMQIYLFLDSNNVFENKVGAALMCSHYSKAKPPSCRLFPCAVWLPWLYLTARAIVTHTCRRRCGDAVRAVCTAAFCFHAEKRRGNCKTSVFEGGEMCISHLCQLGSRLEIFPTETSLMLVYF